METTDDGFVDSAFPAIEAEELESFHEIKEEMVEEDDQISIIFEDLEQLNALASEIINSQSIRDQQQGSERVERSGDKDLQSSDGGNSSGEQEKKNDEPAQTSTAESTKQQKRPRKDNLSAVEPKPRTFTSISELLADASIWGQQPDPNGLKMTVMEEEEPTTQRQSRKIDRAKPISIDRRRSSNDSDQRSKSATTTSSSSIFDLSMTRNLQKSRISILANRGHRSPVSILGRSGAKLTVSGVNEAVFRCSLCPGQFPMKSGLDEHMKSNHNDDLAVISNATRPRTPDDDQIPIVLKPKRRGNVGLPISDAMKLCLNNEPASISQKPANQRSSAVDETATPRKQLSISEIDDFAKLHEQYEILLPKNYKRQAAESDSCHVCRIVGLNLDDHIGAAHLRWRPCLFSRCTAWFESPSDRAHHMLREHSPASVGRLPLSAFRVDADDQSDEKVEAAAEESPMSLSVVDGPSIVLTPLVLAEGPASRPWSLSEHLASSTRNVDQQSNGKSIKNEESQTVEPEKRKRGRPRKNKEVTAPPVESASIKYQWPPHQPTAVKPEPPADHSSMAASTGSGQEGKLPRNGYVSKRKQDKMTRQEETLSAWQRQKREREQAASTTAPMGHGSSIEEALAADGPRASANTSATATITATVAIMPDAYAPLVSLGLGDSVARKPRGKVGRPRKHPKLVKSNDSGDEDWTLTKRPKKKKTPTSKYRSIDVALRRSIEEAVLLLRKSSSRPGTEIAAKRAWEANEVRISMGVYNQEDDRLVVTTPVAQDGICNMCVRQFGSTRNLERHMDMAHQPQAQCPDCGLWFLNRVSLQQHMKEKHK